MRQVLTTVIIAVLLFSAERTYSQDTFEKLPGYKRYESVRRAATELASQGRISGVQWSADGAQLTFRRGRDRYKVALADPKVESVGEPESKKPTVPSSTRDRARRMSQPRVGRAQQATRLSSPDGKWVAAYRDFNVVLEKSERREKKASDGGETAPAVAKPKDNGPESNDPIQVTTGGTEFFRYGTACWVYGEELSQRSAMWWSPDSRKLAFYEIDERHQRNYYLTTDNTQLFTMLQTVRYPKPGTDNPFAGLLIYDLETKLTTRVDVGGDRLQYVYNVRYTPDGTELLFSRTNRRQDTLEVMAADPSTGASRVVVAEKQTTWQANRPQMRFLEDGKRYIWETERTGWKQFELRHLDGRRLNPLSDVARYAAERILRVDEKAGYVYYTAYSDDNPNNSHLHRVRLDGTEHVRLTSRPLNHSSIYISPDDKWFVATCEAVGTPPDTALFDASGKKVVTLANYDSKKADELGVVTPELFSFKADDGETDIYGILYKPTHFDSQKQYPLVISVYGGPSSRGIRNRYSPVNAYCEFGFLVATIANRGTTGRGKAFESATYMKLGGPDIKDQADGVRFLCQRPYVDKNRVGIYGHSYGGYMSALGVLKHPDVFHVGVAGAPVTDWKNYDTIYTERYMRTPTENPDGYHDGSCLTYAENLKGKLLVMHGLIDDNVHPCNTWQLADALLGKNLRFDMIVYPRSKHGLGRSSSHIRWEYLHQHLRPEPLPAPKKERAEKEECP